MWNYLSKRSFTLVFAGCFIAGAHSSSGASAPSEPHADSSNTEFFEQKIRPIFADHCYSCHSRRAEKLRGGLLLDSRETLFKGGDTGPALVPGDPEKSLLIKAVRYTDPDLQMPPKNKKLAPEQIAALETWVKSGAPMPADSLRSARDSTLPHWAFQPVRMPSLPRVKNTGWIQSPVDAFILAKLDERQMHPSPPADRRTLIRRATFDLTGLPPTMEEVRQFENDFSPDAYPRVIERLLSSPRYGERWGRFWLDIARYADTKGYVFEEERRYPYAYTYRDYVIRSFNQDLPYNRFIVEQLAADQLPPQDDKTPLAALGFLTLGRRFLNNQPDIIDDRIDVVTRGLLGLTVTCARCHDHKFDPIPQRDYYSLYGVFASSSEPAQKPLLGTVPNSVLYKKFLDEHNKRETDLAQFQTESEEKALAAVRRRTGEYLLAAYDAGQLKDDAKAEALVRQRKLDPGIAHKWRAFLAQPSQPTNSIFAPWFAFAGVPTNQIATQAPALAREFAEKNSIHPLVRQQLSAHPPATIKDLADLYGKLFTDADTAWTNALHTASHNKIAPPKTLANEDQESLRQFLYAADSPAKPSPSEIFRLFDVPTAQKIRRLRRELEELDATDPGAPARAMVLQDNPEPFQPHVFLRGNPNNPGPEVPRQFLQLIAGPKRRPFQHGSGRLELAQAIANPQNPLTARVLVNRVWMHHFGFGLVRTPSDFGTRSDPPSHPELLDYLASRFMSGGWSIKNLHRLIMLSSTYQQSSQENPEYALKDPNNALLYKMNRQRLDFEALRDSLLEVGDTLDLQTGGHSVEITSEPFATRRTIYGFVDRQNLPGLFRTFDFASPDATSPKRFATTIPQQALFLMNSPFLIQQARQLVHHLDQACQNAPASARIRQLYQWAYQRDPEPDEIQLATQFLEHQSQLPPPTQPPPVWQYGYGTLDSATRKITSFHPLPHFTGQAWQGSGKLPDPALGWVQLTAEGGHPGNDSQHAAIRRWIAPASGNFKILGAIIHDSDKGDGIQAHIISSTRGEIASVVVQHSKTNLELHGIPIEKGEIIDFVVDCRSAPDSDSFKWSPVLRWIEKTGAGQPPQDAWNAQTEFSGPKKPFEPLTPWEKFAQVVLMSNELAFAD